MVAFHREKLGQISPARRSRAGGKDIRQPNQREPMIEAFLRDLRQPEYIHVLLNPIPIYGLAVSLTGLLIAIFLRSRSGQIATLAIVLISAGMAWPVAQL